MSIKISELPSAEAVNNGDYLAIVQDGTTKKATASMLSADIATTINSSSTNNTAAGAKAVYDYAAPKKHDSTAQTYGVGTDEKYGHVMLVDDLNSSSLQAGKALSSHQGYVIKGLLDAKQDIINGYNKIDADYVDDTDSENKFVTEEQIQEIEELKAENEQLLSQIPTATATGETINVQDSSNLPIQEFSMLGNATQADTPTPDYPQDIHVVTGDNTVKVYGAQLFNANEIIGVYSSGVTFTGTPDNFKVVRNNGGSSRRIPLILPKGEYTFKATFNSTGMDGAIQIVYEDDTKLMFYEKYSSQAVSNVSVTKTTDSTKGIKEILFACYGSAYYEMKNFIISGADTDYVPYEAPATQLISLGSIELAKIGDYTDRIYKDNGKWYEYHEVGKVTFTGADTENWGAIVAYDRPYFNIAITDMLVSNNMYNTSLLLSNYFTGYKNSELVIDNVTDYGICRRTNTSELLLYNVDITNASTLRTWLSTHNTSVYYPLATPTTTEITDTTLIGQLENILQMHTNKNVTNAWLEPSGTNAQAGMVLVYRQDLATLIAS